MAGKVGSSFTRIGTLLTVWLMESPLYNRLVRGKEVTVLRRIGTLLTARLTDKPVYREVLPGIEGVVTGKAGGVVADVGSKSGVKEEERGLLVEGGSWMGGDFK